MSKIIVRNELVSIGNALASRIEKAGVSLIESACVFGRAFEREMAVKGVSGRRLHKDLVADGLKLEHPQTALYASIAKACDMAGITYPEKVSLFRCSRLMSAWNRLLKVLPADSDNRTTLQLFWVEAQNPALSADALLTIVYPDAFAPKPMSDASDNPETSDGNGAESAEPVKAKLDNRQIEDFVALCAEHGKLDILVSALTGHLDGKAIIAAVKAAEKAEKDRLVATGK